MVVNWSKLGFIYKPKEYSDQPDVNLYVEHEVNACVNVHAHVCVLSMYVQIHCTYECHWCILLN